jgi:hypothetical protein
MAIILNQTLSAGKFKGKEGKKMEKEEKIESKVVPKDEIAALVLQRYAMWHSEISQKQLCAPCNHCVNAEHCTPCGGCSAPEEMEI